VKCCVKKKNLSWIYFTPPKEPKGGRGTSVGGATVGVSEAVGEAVGAVGAGVGVGFVHASSLSIWFSLMANL
jgi:hypothetical protein